MQLEDRIKQFKKNLSDKKIIKTSDNVGSRVFVDLLSGLLAGSFLGYNLDLYFKSLPLFLFVCTIFGMVGGFYNFYRWHDTKDKRK